MSLEVLLFGFIIGQLHIELKQKLMGNFSCCLLIIELFNFEFRWSFVFESQASKSVIAEVDGAEGIGRVK